VRKSLSYLEESFFKSFQNLLKDHASSSPFWQQVINLMERNSLKASIHFSNHTGNGHLLCYLFYKADRMLSLIFYTFSIFTLTMLGFLIFILKFFFSQPIWGEAI
jgi:hypothetical protein